VHPAAGVGEALVSTLDEQGAPTVVSRTKIRPPASRLGPLTDAERAQVMGRSPVGGVYDERIDRDSAHERLTARAEESLVKVIPPKPRPVEPEPEHEPVRERPAPRPRARAPARQSDTMGEAFAKSFTRSFASAVGGAIVRSILGSPQRRRRR
jgi:hypothetical protein